MYTVIVIKARGFDISQHTDETKAFDVARKAEDKIDTRSVVVYARDGAMLRMVAGRMT